MAFNNSKNKFKGNYKKGESKAEYIKPYRSYSSEYEEGEDNGVVVGRNAVRELLKSERGIEKVYVKKGTSREGSITVLVAEAIERGIPVVEIEGQKLDSLAQGTNHQGIVAIASIKEYSTIDDMLELASARGEKPLIVIADSIEDPHNLGALIRCAECAGAHGLIIPKRRAVGITPTVYKSSAGAIEHMLIAKVSNIATTIEQLKKKGLWIFTSEAGGTPYYETDFNCACAVVLGSEGNGVSKIVKDNSDYIVSIPMYGKVNSLNVSTAASVILCHVARMQRKE
ncbi:MAG: 23S rRNA (guanosine(2251)-2'-O)-methyltransferase RlmB [Clostridia bacterium]|nr:23S rRNA (guanosine(2251)-2'-O)-methyltransferase RlmB [Clostridia bacterium]